jgi:photosystem II stability/assembly factor-like uncharacterized protein
MRLNVVRSFLAVLALWVPCAIASMPLDVGPEIRFFVFHPSNPDIVYAATRSGVFVTTDQGGRWTRQSGLPMHAIVWALVMHPQDPDRLLAGIQGGREGVYRTADGGKTWHATGLPGPVYALAVDPRRPDVMFAASRLDSPTSSPSGGGLFKSTDGGASWQLKLDGPRIHVGALAIDPRDPERIYIGSDGIVLRSSDGGIAWTRSEELVSRGRPVWVGDLTVDVTNSDVIYADTGGGQVKSTDGGMTWKPLETACRPYRIGRQASKTLYASCGSGAIVPMSIVRKSTDGGASWQTVGPGLPKTWFAPDIAAHPAKPDIVFASWANGGAYKSIDGGQTWITICNGITWRDIADQGRPPARNATCAEQSGAGNAK